MISLQAKIHPTALVSEDATIAKDVEIGPFCIVEATVSIDEGTKLISNVVVKGNTTIGKNNNIFPFAVIGEINQDLKYSGEDTKVIIGNNNSIREHSTIHIGTVNGSGITSIGDNNLLMVNSHVAHDCNIGDRVILANNATLAGHVTIGDFAIVGGLSGVHQFCIIGAHAMVGACSMVAQDVPPFVLCHGNHAIPYGINIEGLRRRGFDSQEITVIREAYSLIYKSGKRKEDILLQLEDLARDYTCISFFTRFFADSTRGIIRAKNKTDQI